MPPRRTSSLQSVTLRDVAKSSGVHLSTASRALDPAKRHLIADAVVSKIVAVADRLGYRRDPVAASLRTRRSKLVGVIVPDIANPVFSPIIAAITETLSAAGYSTIVADGGQDRKRQSALVGELIARRVDGLVLATVRRDDPILKECLNEDLAVVLVNRTDDSDRVSSVVTDDNAGMRLAVDHLVELGHRQIGHIAGPAHISTGHLRRQGFEEAMAARGLKYSERAIVEAAAYEREAGEMAAAELLKENPKLTAIAAANDLLALGAYRAIAAAGLSCPRDISVVGHNDMPLADMVEPPLTTIRIGPREMGHDAARLMIARIQEPNGAVKRVVLSPSLVTRTSTAAPKQ
ncbi:MAG: LacI family transcriptional regulator [Xanthobacteraceae bacterium]|nr:LacI family transcriptional regulator [Xanthobacteraceae bacterium]